MSHAALTQRYRPQTFADVAGQATLKAILSRAALEGRVAPAYLFSGTRGVGKTTIARIFAKALNCKKSPAAEPCNDCDNCRAITLGGSVDVVEIDGASNRGIDDVRRLKESVGYAPMDGRYKIFIIDEAHMLSREAFNALLKTLEEPPARVTFIMATTEPHKFPVTILSRCQHYVFKRLSDLELEEHLTKILKMENAPYEDAAVRLIVRRASGSVRDAMSLLGQVLALGGESLSESDTRMVLGLAGQELFFKLLARIKAADSPGISALVREMLDQGLDLGFFLRELTSMWRNLFMLCQSGEAARGVVDLPEAEVERWLQEAQSFDIGHIHAAWQMSLEGQRRVLTSLEPALALELLLLNLAMLPRLLSMEQLSVLSRQVSSGTASAEAEKKSPITRAEPVPASVPAGLSESENTSHHDIPEPPSGPSEAALPDPMHTGAPDAPSLPDPAAVLPSAAAPEQEAEPETTPAPAEPDAAGSSEKAALPFTAESYVAAPASTDPAADGPSMPPAELTAGLGTPPAPAIDDPANTPSTPAASESTNMPSTPAASGSAETPPDPAASGSAETPPDPAASGLADSLPSPAPSEGQGSEGDWSGFALFCTELAKSAPEVPVSLGPLLNKMKVSWENGAISLEPPDVFSSGQITDKNNMELIKSLLGRFCGSAASIKVLPPPDRELDKQKLVEQINGIPAIKAFKEKLGAEFVDYGPWRE